MKLTFKPPSELVHKVNSRPSPKGVSMMTTNRVLLAISILGEMASVQLRVEFFKIPNRANFQGPLRTRLLEQTMI